MGTGAISLTAATTITIAAGALAIASVISGGFALNKAGSGTETLTAANTFTGGTTLSAGMLYVNNASGSGTGTGAVIVSGGTLAGTGGISGSLTVSSGGTFDPGVGGPSSFASGSFSIASGGTFNVDINSSTAGSGYDQLNVTGAVDLTGSSLHLNGTRTSNGGDTIVLINNDGADAVTGTFNGLAEGALVSLNGVNYNISYHGGTGNDVVLTDAAPTVATAASATPSPVTGTTTALSVLGASSNGESTLTYTWAVTSQPASSNPLISSNGSNADKNVTVTFDTAGSYTFQVTISDGTYSAMSSVSVTVNQTLTTIVMSPTSATLNENATQQFTATGKDQFGAVMAAQPTFTWSKTSGVGSVDSTGLYTAPYGTGSAVIQASSGAVSNTAAVTVNNAAPTIATHAAATPSTVTGTTTSLSVLGADDGGENNLTYTWSVTAQPASSSPGFGPNGSNAAKNITVTFDKSGSYTFQVVIDDGTHQVTDTLSVTVNQTLTSIAVSPASATLNENATQQFTAVAFDQFNVAMAAQPSFTWSQISGVGSIDASGLYTAPYGAGSAVIKAASAAVNGTASITVNNAAPTIATHAAATPNPVTGLTTALSVLGADDGGEANLTYAWTVTASPASSNPLFSANNTNAAKSTTVTFDKAGNYTFQVTIDDGTNQVTDTISVTVNQTLTSIALTPATVTLNENATQQFTAVGNDQFGDPLTIQPPITWTIVTGVGAVDTSGLYAAPHGTGTATVKAANGAVSNTAAITVINATPTIATHAAATPSPVSGTTTTFSVLGADDGGENNLTYTWSVTSQPASSNPAFGPNGSNAAKNITATFDEAGTYTLHVVIDDGTNQISDDVTVTINQTLTSIAVSPATQTLNENDTQQFTAVAYDQFNAPMSAQPSFTWSKTAGVGTVNGSGIYTAPYGTGSATVQATVGAISNTAAITINNAPPTIVTHDAANPNPVTGLTTDLSVLAADDGGESNLIYSWSITSKPAGSHPLITTNNSNAAKNTTIMFDTAGNYTFLVTIDDGTNQITDSITLTVQQTLTSITVTPNTATLNENGTQQFAATGYDQFNAVMAVQPAITWSQVSGVGSIDGTGLYTAPYGTGSAIIKAANGAVSGTASITVNNATPTIATHTAASPSPVTGLTTNLSVLGADDGGENNLTYSWTLTSQPVSSNPLLSNNGNNAAKNITVTFDTAGSYAFLVTIDDGTNNVTDTVTVVVNQTLTSIAISPSSAALNENQTQQFTAVAKDQFGDPMSTQPSFTWSEVTGVGSIDTTGLYTAPYGTGSATIQAASGAVSNTATITVTNAPPTIATHASATPSPVTGLTTVLSVLGADDGGENNLTYSWSVTSQPPSSNPAIAPNGNNAAKNATVTFDTAGTYTFLVTINDGTHQVTDSVTVVVNQTLTTITVSPATQTLNENDTQQFTAVAYDQFHNAMTVQPSFTWSKTAGVGSLNGTGVYTAPYGTGSATIRAASGAVSNTASITITNAAPTIVTHDAANPTPVIGTTTDLSVLADDDGGETNLTYTWSLTAQPPSSVPHFSINGTNAAKNTTVTFDTAGSYTFLVTIDDGTNQIADSITVVVDQTLTSIDVSPATQSLDEIQTQQFSATGIDQFGNPLAAQPSFNWTKLSGVGAIDTTGLYTAPYGTGTATIQADSGGVTGSATITINNAAPTIATHEAATPIPVIGLTTALSVLGADDGGESNLTYHWSFASKPASSNPTFSINSTNAAKNTTVTFDKAGSYTIDVTIDDGTSTVSDSLVVSVQQTLASIALSPTSATLNENDTQQFAATGIDQFGDPLTTQPPFTWTEISGVGAIDSSGRYTAPYGTGTATIQVASGAVSNSATLAINNATPTIATHAAANPSPVVATTTNLSVLGADDGGESNLTYNWSVTSKPAGSAPAFDPNNTNAAKNTTITFDEAGTYTFHVIIDDGTNQVTDDVTVTVNQTLASIAVSPATQTLNENDTQRFTAIAYDQFNAPMSTQPSFTWSKTAGVGSINGTGLYTAPYGTGSATVQATVGAISNTATLTINNAPPAIVTHAVATPSPVNGTATVLSVLASDDGGETHLTYSWSVTAQPPSSRPAFSITGTNAAKNTTVTFDTAGNYTFLVTIDDGTHQITDTVSVTVSQTLTAITVTPASATLNENGTQQFSAVAFDQFGAAMLAQPTFTWSRISGIGAIDYAGNYTAPASAGTATIQAAAGSVVSTATITINNAPPTIVTHAGALPSPVTGLTTNLSVLATDDNAEPNLTYSWSVTSRPAAASPTFSDNATNSAKNTTVTFDSAGTYTFQVAISDGANITTDTVTVVVRQTLTTLAISPASAALSENQSTFFTATLLDQFGRPMAPAPALTWSLDPGSVGAIDATGNFAAGVTPGVATVRATTEGGGALTTTANVTVSNAAPTLSSPAIASPSEITGTTTTLHAAATDDGGSSNLTFAWSATNLPPNATPTFSINSTNAAKDTLVTFNRAGVYTFLVTISDGLNTLTSSVTLTVDQTFNGLTLSPRTATVTAGGTAQFTATEFDQFNTPMIVPVPFQWSTTDNNTIDPTGLFTAHSSSQTATVSITSGAHQASAAITIDHPASGPTSGPTPPPPPPPPAPPAPTPSPIPSPGPACIPALVLPIATCAARQHLHRRWKLHPNAGLLRR